MELIPNWKSVSLKSYSNWCQYLGIILLLVVEGAYLIHGIDLNGVAVGRIALGLLLLGPLVRVLNQGLDRDRLGSPGSVTIVAFLAVCVPLVAQWEGKENRAYLDRIAHPPVWTVCHGETNGVKPGDYYTDEECAEMLGKRLLEYRQGLHAYFSPRTLRHHLTAHRDAAFVSLAYNAGIHAAGRSTATRRLNAGDLAGACKALTWWTRAGGRVVRGLVRRRAAEYELCMRGIA